VLEAPKAHPQLKELGRIGGSLTADICSHANARLLLALNSVRLLPATPGAAFVEMDAPHANLIA
jgi:hypothetical protein